MYPIDADAIRVAAVQPSRLRKIAPTVWLLGFTSLFTDISSEMITSILPAYVILHLRLSPLQFGLLDGLYQGVTVLLRPVGGFVADRWRRHKEVAAAGYLLSAVCKLGWLAAGGMWNALVGVVALDRAGKGLRTAPRDAMLAHASAQEDRAAVFGVHRALDAAGAMLGPLVAFAVLSFVPGGFDVIFVTSFCVAIIGAGILVLLVSPSSVSPSNVATGTTLRALVAPLQETRFRTIAIVGCLFSLMTISDGFVYLRLQNRLSWGTETLPLMYAGTSLAYLLLAAPAGFLADRWGRGRVLLAGYALLVLLYAILVVPVPDSVLLVGGLVLLGAYYAATDGVFAALATTAVPPAVYASSLATLTTLTSLCRLCASVAFGALWTWRGPDFAVICFGFGLGCSGLAARALLGRSGDVSTHAIPKT
jgi:MFS family permease